MQEQTVKYINIICSILIIFFLLISVLIYYFPNLVSKYFTLNKKNLSIDKNLIENFVINNHFENLLINLLNLVLDLNLLHLKRKRNLQMLKN